MNGPVLLSTGAAPKGAKRLRRGAWISADDWQRMDHLDRRRAQVFASARALRIAGVVSHRSAAALWSLPDLDRPEHRLHVVDPARARTHTGRLVVRHVGTLGSDEITMLDGLPVTSLLRTVADVARTSSTSNAVAVLDHVLHLGLASRPDLEHVFGELSGRGASAARAALGVADARAESPGESWSRTVARDLGAPRPELQREFRTDAGRFRVDFWWASAGVIGEFDGREKYGFGDPDSLWREKRREDSLRRISGVRSVARWTFADLQDPRRFAAILLAAGLPLARAVALG